ncbi:Scr1 family TA system antitoxin-like transcriptional regulator [Streptomyces hainanensis]|uniref:XRE family transcriptional regulator n=1 Tax=Streptomyces hainanensis TaxID=402648 RepID=A0A4R4TES0_9ACTN|nr:Scr1 family TA system antitoxin-like transcriptional regulator [Streptomyces hainanensis]TDC74094.1 XRE family transcriptional regulator [Streptomyces hainanensis]
MASRKAPTARQRRIGTELRRMREHAGFSIADGAALLGTDRTNISNLEGARFGVSAERVRQFAANYNCPDPAYVEGLAAMAATRVRGWWTEYQGVLPAGAVDLAELEYHARQLTVVEHLHIPGLLQTEEHARAVLRLAIPQRSDVELLRRLTHRMKRKTVFERDQPTPCVFLVHEAALRMRLGGTDVQRRQLDRLLEESERDHITLLAIPFAADGYAGAGSSITLAAGVTPKLDTVQLDSPHGVVFLDGEAQLIRYRTTLERMREVTLSPSESRDFIRTARDEL